jgi:hypothetical protein
MWNGTAYSAINPGPLTLKNEHFAVSDKVQHPLQRNTNRCDEQSEGKTRKLPISEISDKSCEKSEMISINCNTPTKCPPRCPLNELKASCVSKTFKTPTCHDSAHGSEIEAGEHLSEIPILESQTNIDTGTCMKKVPIYGDGNCFFRSVVSSGSTLLATCTRSDTGWIDDDTYADIETNLAKCLKDKILALVLENCDVLGKLDVGHKMALLEYSPGKYYDSFQHRASQIAKSEYVGALEIVATSIFLQCPISMFELNRNTGQQIHKITYGEGKFSTQIKPISMLYTSDIGSDNNVGHYDLLMHENLNTFTFIDTCMENPFELWQEINKSFPSTSLVSFATMFEHIMPIDAADVLANVAVDEHGILSRESSVLTNDNAHVDNMSSNSSPQKPLSIHDRETLLCDSAVINANKNSTKGNNVLSDHNYFTSNKTEEVSKEKTRGRVRSFKEMGLSTKLSLEKHCPMFRENTGVRSLSEHFEKKTLKEVEALKQFKSRVFWHTVERNECDKMFDTMSVPDLRCKLYLEDTNTCTAFCEKSNIVYLAVVNEHADKIETVKYIIDELDDTFHKSGHYQDLTIVGDAKTFDHITALKREYGSDLAWVVPFIGDFHVLLNFQHVLIKLAWDAGLLNLGKRLHNSAAFTQLHSCSNFNRTHEFLLQTHEALLRYQIEQFLRIRHKMQTSSSSSAFPSETISDLLIECVTTLDRAKDHGYSDIKDFLKKQKFMQRMLEGLESEFEEFRRVNCEKDDTFRFWDNYIHNDCMYYVGLFIAVRCGNWDLRMSCLRDMIPLFSITDHQNYARILPQHLADIDQMPELILKQMKMGGFSASLKGTPFASLALDETQERTMNRDIKMAISKGEGDYIASISSYLPFRAKLVTNIKYQLLTHRSGPLHEDLTKSVIDKVAANIHAYIDMLSEAKVSAFSTTLTTENRGLLQIFTGSLAAEDVTDDLLNYSRMGVERVNNYIEYKFKKQASKHVVITRKNLKTFAPPKQTKVQTKRKEKDLNLLVKCYKRMLTHSKQTNTAVAECGQLFEYPLAMATSEGSPYSGTKSYATDFFKARYDKNVEGLFLSELPQTHTFECALLEGMFMVKSAPLGSYRRFMDYGDFIIRRWVRRYFAMGFKQVQIIFDDPLQERRSPKEIERAKRDDAKEIVNTYTEIHPLMKLPGRGQWEDFIGDRKNKIGLCDFLCRYMQSNVAPYCYGDKSLIVAGGYQGDKKNLAYCMNRTSTWVVSDLESDHEEADSRIWLHVTNPNLIHTLCTVQILMYTTLAFHYLKIKM